MRRLSDKAEGLGACLVAWLLPSRSLSQIPSSPSPVPEHTGTLHFLEGLLDRSKVLIEGSLVHFGQTALGVFTSGIVLIPTAGAAMTGSVYILLQYYQIRKIRDELLKGHRSHGLELQKLELEIEKLTREATHVIVPATLDEILKFGTPEKARRAAKDRQTNSGKLRAVDPFETLAVLIRSSGLSFKLPRALDLVMTWTLCAVLLAVPVHWIYTLYAQGELLRTIVFAVLVVGTVSALYPPGTNPLPFRRNTPIRMELAESLRAHCNAVFLRQHILALVFLPLALWIMEVTWWRIDKVPGVAGTFASGVGLAYTFVGVLAFVARRAFLRSYD